MGCRRGLGGEKTGPRPQLTSQQLYKLRADNESWANGAGWPRSHPGGLLRLLSCKVAQLKVDEATSVSNESLCTEESAGYHGYTSPLHIGDK